MVNLAKVYIWGEYAGAVLWNENTGIQSERRMDLASSDVNQ